MSPLRSILLIEDHTMVAQLMTRHLAQAFPSTQIQVVRTKAELAGITEAYDVVLADLELPDGNILEWVNEYVTADPEQRRVIIISSIRDDYTLHKTFTSVIQGFVHKEEDLSILETAIAAVRAGGIYMSPEVQKMRSRMTRQPDFFHKLLSAREQEVLVLLGNNLSCAEIAAHLGLSSSTIVDHRKEIMRKTGTHSQAELMRYAITKGFTKVTR